MFMVDSSVWIDHFNGVLTPEVAWLRRQFLGEQVQVADLILTEVLQGFRSARDFRAAYLELTALPVVMLGGEDMAVLAAIHYRRLRAKGITIRKTIDVLIGTYCIENKLPLLYSDRDFDPMVKHLGLKSAISLH